MYRGHEEGEGGERRRGDGKLIAETFGVGREAEDDDG